ncbi:MAG: hypothetical protein A4E52_00492 [Pelotomaculum sp. PtaB.Bin013]|uniref:Uncharacterized protein n=1 Tax=Pelotomaculum isophthalicicum JI TaxID=947010 RepID=A0A9X4H6I1_9FIRM|nr:hypothetical protein [Pelotomaculum isophthalicicum]MDF9408489.1 hypothetical protein [Pelotomaculum isophthalicicum JI]OPX91497.1 MAG: hypothetical protein A4E52_00492 [Pelotomaculum sp. PtaB.Bin013]
MDTGFISNWLQAIATLLAAFVTILTYIIYRRLNNVEKTKIVLDIYERLFTRKECIKIIEKIELGEGKFWIPVEDKEIQNREDIITDLEIDEYLGFFELLGDLVKRNIIDFKDVYNAFSYYIKMTWKHKGIREYIDDLRNDEKDPEIYENLEYLSGMVILRSEGGFNLSQFVKEITGLVLIILFFALIGVGINNENFTIIFLGIGGAIASALFWYSSLQNKIYNKIANSARHHNNSDIK